MAVAYPDAQLVVTEASWRRIARELKYAVATTPSRELGRWAADAARATLKFGGRRIRNLAELAALLVKEGYAEAGRVYGEAGTGSVAEAAAASGKRIAGNAWEAAKGASQRLASTARMLTRPERGAEAVVAVVAALVASGGVDGDGGIPDLDLAVAGIDAHRSVLTHSIVAGTVVEASLYATATLIKLVHARLPEDHDGFFDVIHRNSGTYLKALSLGASAGLAYHFLVDAVVEPAPYKDIPVSMPMEAHQALQATNSAAEAVDTTRKEGTFRRAEVPPSVRQGTTGELWFGRYEHDDGSLSRVIVVPEKGRSSRALVELFFADEGAFRRLPQDDTWGRLRELPADGAAHTKRLMAERYRQARQAH